MKYLDNLIAWGDSLFRQDTIETINEATQVYVLAANLLGPKPQPVPPRGEPRRMSYAQLKAAGIDAFGNALVELENAFPFDIARRRRRRATPASSAAFGIGRTLYFCIPPNDKLLAYWDQVADRLFKIRHCMNIEGVVRQLALFDPPIDPGALVQGGRRRPRHRQHRQQHQPAGVDAAGPAAAAEGAGAVQRGEDAAARRCCSAIEKGEAEHLALLRQSARDATSLQLAREVRFLQWKEAEAATDALLASRATVWERYRHYKRILGVSDGEIECGASRSTSSARS